VSRTDSPSWLSPVKERVDIEQLRTAFDRAAVPDRFAATEAARPHVEERPPSMFVFWPLLRGVDLPRRPLGWHRRRTRRMDSDIVTEQTRSAIDALPCP